MKQRMRTIVRAISILLLNAAVASCTSTEENKVVSDGIRFCESTYPYQGGILIANFGSEQLNPLNTEGKGYILHYKKGEMKTLIPADGHLSAPKGMFEKNGYLYICDVNKLVVYNLKALDRLPQTVFFQNDDLFLNDLAASGNTLYISVTNSGRIYQLDINNPAELNKYPLVKWLDIAGPNGIVIDGKSMYIASYPADGKTTDKNIIYKVEDLDNPVAEPFFNVPGQYDGIALSGNTLYISNWTPAEVTAVSIKDKKTTKVPLDTQPAGPADMTLEKGTLYIPDLPNSRVLIQNLK